MDFAQTGAVYWAADYAKGLRLKDAALCALALEQMTIMAPYLGRNRRALLGIALPILRSTTLSRAAYQLRLHRSIGRRMLS